MTFRLANFIRQLIFRASVATQPFILQHEYSSSSIYSSIVTVFVNITNNKHKYVAYLTNSIFLCLIWPKQTHGKFDAAQVNIEIKNIMGKFKIKCF